jgi:hypothetical protein
MQWWPAPRHTGSLPHSSQARAYRPRKSVWCKQQTAHAATLLMCRHAHVAMGVSRWQLATPSRPTVATSHATRFGDVHEILACVVARAVWYVQCTTERTKEPWVRTVLAVRSDPPPPPPTPTHTCPHTHHPTHHVTHQQYRRAALGGNSQHRAGSGATLHRCGTPARHDYRRAPWRRAWAG